MRRDRIQCGERTFVGTPLVVLALLTALLSSCAANGDDACDPNDGCTPVECGNGIVEEGEDCDEGSENSDAPDSACRLDCTERRCGDGIVGLEEDCDDGNRENGDECSSACRFELCGNGILDGASSVLPHPEECDGGDFLSHDGCSSACLIEDLSWQQVPNPPTGHFNHSMAYDPVRKEIVLFGGKQATGPSNDTWTWDGTLWMLVVPSTSSPPARTNHTMFYDQVRQSIVIFGGDASSNGTALLDDMWEWNGEEWIDITPSSGGPEPRLAHTMVYDLARSSAIMFGGQGALNELFNDTWEWDGSSWTQMSPATVPSARAGHGSVYDQATQRAVMFGGFATLSPPIERLGDTWEWNGVDWLQRSPTTSPSPRGNPSMTYDTVLNRTVLFGGTQSDDDGSVDDTWHWDGTTWVEQFPATTTPPALAFPELAFDVERGTTVLYAKKTGPGGPERTWGWDGVDWRVLRHNSVPRGGFAVSYDSNRGRVVLLASSSSTWEWTGIDWEPKDTTGSAPLAIRDVAMEFDAARSKTILFGGSAVSTGAQDSTWLWDGEAWAEQTQLVLKPPARSKHAMAYDSVRNRVVLFGGEGGADRLGDTWEWDGMTWTQISTASAPEQRALHTMVFDPVSETVILHGGDSSGGAFVKNFDDTWAFDGQDWVEVSTGPGNAPRIATLAFDAVRRVVVGFGNLGSGAANWEWDGQAFSEANVVGSPGPVAGLLSYDAAGNRLLVVDGFETWFLQAGSEATEDCLASEDLDGDGLAGCDDPDCWGRCTPDCLPHSTPLWPTDCDKTTNACGDGVCNASLETQALCPGDCAP